MTYRIDTYSKPDSYNHKYIKSEYVSLKNDMELIRYITNLSDTYNNKYLKAERKNQGFDFITKYQGINVYKCNNL